jgi:hypothetical protein
LRPLPLSSLSLPSLTGSLGALDQRMLDSPGDKAYDHKQLVCDIVDQLKQCQTLVQIPSVILTLIAQYGSPVAGPYIFLIGRGVSWLDTSLLDTSPVMAAATTATSITLTSLAFSNPAIVAVSNKKTRNRNNGTDAR